jgi:hypothetical protein
MGMLRYMCPTARNDVASGIGLDKRTYELSRLKVVEVVSCPACGRRHRFLMADGWLQDEQAPVLH